jgi:hypothetical protein
MPAVKDGSLKGGERRNHGCNSEMARAVEVPRVFCFENKTSRMPGVARHELAHAWKGRRGCSIPLGSKTYLGRFHATQGKHGAD